MKIYSDVDLRDFKFWSGAKANAAMLTDDELIAVDDALSAEGYDYSETELNDLFWFDFPYVCEMIGLEFDEENDEVVRESVNRSARRLAIKSNRIKTERVRTNRAKRMRRR